MSDVFDLLGDPIPEGWGKRGRPQHIPSQQYRNKVMMLLAFGWNNERIAKALSITPPTLRKHYRPQLKVRGDARDKLDATLAYRLWTEAMGGNVGAAKEFQKLLEKNDMMTYASGPEEVKEPRLGKKERALKDAREPDTSTELGQLMAEIEGLPN